MRTIHLAANRGPVSGDMIISGSKSISNRLIILQALFGHLKLQNLSDSTDTEIIDNSLKKSPEIIDVGHAGTAFRFLTSYFSCREGERHIITGSDRLKQRPIKPLIDALKRLGADITYLDTPGQAPIEILGKRLTGSTVSIDASQSSQFISALLLIGGTLQKGLDIRIIGQRISGAYIDMTVSLLEQAGLSVITGDQRIKVLPLISPEIRSQSIESDWSSASYWYNILAMAEEGEFSLSCFYEKSIQGDQKIAGIYHSLGVETSYCEGVITLRKIPKNNSERLDLDLCDQPDMAQSLAVTCYGLRLPCRFTGLSTLALKETDRLVAMKIELEKLNARVNITKNSLEMWPPSILPQYAKVSTYEDHRMAMAFAGLACKMNVEIANPEVVAKSYPHFWKDMKSMGFLAS